MRCLEASVYMTVFSLSLPSAATAGLPIVVAEAFLLLSNYSRAGAGPERVAAASALLLIRLLLETHPSRLA